MDAADILGLFLHFLLLSLIAIGGINTLIPDIHRYVVEVHQWMTSKQFADAFALAQASPGPNLMYITLIGWQVAGWWGAIATTMAVILPSGTVTVLFIRLSHNRDAPLGRALRGGLAPIALGFMIASGWILVRTVNEDWRGYLLTVIALVLTLRTRWNPLWLIAAGAAAGAAGFV